MKKVLGVVAARGGSKGFPGKNLSLLGGVPLITHTIQAALKSQLLDDFLVSTDDQQIATVARNSGASVPFLRPKELATDEVSVWPAVLHAAKYWEKEKGETLEVVVLLQATSPLRNSEDIDGAIRRYREVDADICTTVTISHDNPYFNLVESIQGKPFFVRPCIPGKKGVVRRQDLPKVYAVNGAVYVIKRPLLSGLESQSQLNRCVMYEMPRDRSVDIDEPYDLEYANWLHMSAK